MPDTEQSRQQDQREQDQGSSQQSLKDFTSGIDMESLAQPMWGQQGTGALIQFVNAYYDQADRAIRQAEEQAQQSRRQAEETIHSARRVSEMLTLQWSQQEIVAQAASQVLQVLQRAQRVTTPTTNNRQRQGV